MERLSQNEELWPSNSVFHTELPEVRVIRPVLVVTQTPDFQFAERYSSWSRMTRIAAYVLRFCYNAQTKIVSERRLKALSVTELSNATTVLLRKMHSVSFSSEIAELKANKPVGRRSALRSLNPFLDQDGLLRVGGLPL